MPHYVLLLRGVMPTGKNKVLMEPLRHALGKAGFENVRTYIQSGNVLLSSKYAPEEVETRVSKLIKKEFGGDIPVFARTHKELTQILAQWPFKTPDSTKHYFTLLSSVPEKKRLTEFLKFDFTPDKIHVVGEVIYTEYATKVSNSKFNNNYFEKN